MEYHQAIRDYFDCYKEQNKERLRALLVKDFRYVSVFGEWTDRDAMIEAIWPAVTGRIYATNIEIYGDSPEFLVRYVHGGDSSAHIAEYVRFEGEKIAEIEVYFGVGSMPGGTA